MGSLDRRALELNELKWWSNWAKLTWLDENTHMLTSKDFPEPFFNRAGFLTCRNVRSSAVNAEKRFRDLGIDPLILAYESCADGLQALARLGYHKVDAMSVMASARSGVADGSVQVRSVTPSTVEEWSRTYLLSFYGEEGLLPQVVRVVRRLVGRRGVSLLEGVLGGGVVGVLAIFRSPGLAGVYCVGTLPEFRRRGVASTLLGHAAKIASAEGWRLILQTLRSDHAEPLYLSAGFRIVYRKAMMGKRE